MLGFSYLLFNLVLADFLLVALVQIFVLKVLSHFGLCSFLDRNSVKVVFCFMIAAGFLFQSRLALEEVAAGFVRGLRHISESRSVVEYLLLLLFR